MLVFDVYLKGSFRCLFYCLQLFFFHLLLKNSFITTGPPICSLHLSSSSFFSCWVSLLMQSRLGNQNPRRKLRRVCIPTSFSLKLASLSGTLEFSSSSNDSASAFKLRRHFGLFEFEYIYTSPNSPYSSFSLILPKIKTRANNTQASSTSSTCGPSDTACSSCSIAFNTVDACSSRLAHFDDLSDDQAAQCLCYDPAPGNSSSSIWIPNQFDAPYSLCPQWASTADSDDVSDYSSGLNFCSSVGNVLKVTSSNMASQVTATTVSKGTGKSTAVAGSTAGAATASSTAKSGAAAVRVLSVSLNYFCFEDLTDPD
jgi:hypothetical protein